MQELLRAHPDILPVGENEPVYTPLISIGREVAAGTGSIDNLFISPQGYLVLVETKLWRNPEARREVLAQTIDYASALSRWTYADLDQATRKYTQKYEKTASDLVGWIVKNQGEMDLDRRTFEETVSKNLRLGRILVLLVGDRIRASMVDMLQYVNRYPHLAMNVALVELSCYTLRAGQPWPLLVVPPIVARTEIVERSVVEVTLSPDVPHQVQVIQ
ncbi:MAG: hypothetical protein PHQ40_20355 [Anaerolineaceae bacterium]|nr:hypothetical protein [Anaerolineaceae bacterium]